MNTSAPVALSNAILYALNIHASVDGLQRHGQVALANDSLFSQATFQQAETTSAIGYADPYRNQLSSLLEFIAPTRPSVGRKTTIKVYDEDEPFQAVDYQKLVRSELGEFSEVRQRSSTEVARNIPNLGLTVRLDNDQIAEMPNWKQMHMEWLVDLVKRAQILKALSLYTAIAATDTLTWDAAADPDYDIQSININALAPATGFKANRALLGESATLLRQTAYRSGRDAKNIAGAAAKTDAEIATSMGLASVRTNVERYDDGADKVNFLGSKVLLFTANDRPSMEDSSNIVRHVAPGYGGGNLAMFIEERHKITLMTVDLYELFATQHTSGVALLTVQ